MYAEEMDTLNVYNGKKNGYPWCNVFVDWCFYKAVGIKRTRELLIGFSAGCTQDYNWFKSANQIVAEPQVGDLVFFGKTSHIGIIEKVENGKIYTIEGNTSNAAELIINGGQVAKKAYDINSENIHSFARPKYSENEVQEIPKEGNNEETKQEEQITYSLIKKGSKGNLVRIAQERLIVKGYKLPKYGVDGDFGSETEKAVKELQKDAKIDIDGIIGNNTWRVLNSDFVKPNAPAYPGYYIEKGQVSEDVRKVQDRLIQLGYNCGRKGADSIFGENTKRAVIAFQKANGLEVDGIVGPKTFEKLFN